MERAALQGAGKCSGSQSEWWLHSVFICTNASTCPLKVNYLLFSCSFVSNSLHPHWLQHARFPCPSPSPGACSNSCPLNWWCHPTILSSVIPFSYLQSFPALGSFAMSWLFASGGHSIGGSALSSVLLMNIQGWFPLGIGWFGLWGPRDPQESSPTPQFESINSSVLSLLYGTNLTSIHDSWRNCSFYYMKVFQQSDVSAF